MKNLMIAFALLVGFSAHAADTKKADAKQPDAAMMQKFMAASTPGAPHKILSDMAGDYTFTSKNWHSKGGPVIEGKGMTSMKMVLGGRWLQATTTGESAGEMPAFEGMQMMGYDNIKKEYMFMWYDTMSTGVMHGHGKFDGALKTLTDKGHYSCPMTGKDRDYRGEWKMQSPGNIVFSLFGTSPMDEKSGEFKMMELTFKRK